MKHLLITTIAAVLLVGTAFADPIHTAAINGDLAGVQAELDKGADVNEKAARGFTPLHYAVINDHKEIAELLIAAGANVNAKDAHDWIPLNQAVDLGHKGIVELLIAAGADLNAGNRARRTPFHGAALWWPQGNRRTANRQRCGCECQG